MSDRTRIRSLSFRSHNRKSKIQNPKWLGLSTIAFVLMVAGAAAQAQQPTKIPQIGFLSTAALSSLSPRLDAFHQGLRELGYIENKNISIEYRSAEGKVDRLADLAAELVRSNVACIVTAGENPTRAAKQATGSCQGNDKPVPDRVCIRRHDDRNRFGCILCSAGHVGPIRNDDLDIELDQLSRELGNQVFFALGIAPLDGNILSFDVGELVEPLAKFFDARIRPGRSC